LLRNLEELKMKKNASVRPDQRSSNFLLVPTFDLFHGDHRTTLINLFTTNYTYSGRKRWAAGFVGHMEKKVALFSVWRPEE
jgi:hypothetical protein